MVWLRLLLGFQRRVLDRLTAKTMLLFRRWGAEERAEVKSISWEAYAAAIVAAGCVIIPAAIGEFEFAALVGALSALCAYVALESGRTS
jgi:hypothetical protein